MRIGRLVLAALLGGVVMFAWGAFIHMATPLAHSAIKSLPAETTLLPQLKQAITARGFYFFPGMDFKDTSEAAQKAWTDRNRAGPRGILIYDPEGGEPMSPTQLGTEFASGVLAALLLAIVLAQVPAGWFVRGLLAAVLGAFAWASVDVSYWNWYGFPDAFALAGLIEQAGGWLLGGIAIALGLGRRPTGTPPPATP